VACSPGSGCTNSTVWTKDSNGNRITVANSYNTTTSTNTGAYTDATNNNPIAYSFQSSPTGTSSDTYTYPNASGGTETVQVSYSAYTLKTNFQCPGKTDINFLSRWLPTTISLPDGSSYVMVYESLDCTYPSSTVTGRL